MWKPLQVLLDAKSKLSVLLLGKGALPNAELTG